MATWFAPIEGKHNSFPTGARVCFTSSSYFAPFPGSALVGLASPGGFGSGSFRPWLASPGVSGGPLSFSSFLPPFLFLFCYLVRLAMGLGFESN